MIKFKSLEKRRLSWIIWKGSGVQCSHRRPYKRESRRIRVKEMLKDARLPPLKMKRGATDQGGL